jgi:ABC-type multidrug transport system fused ATPase/permease subunit
MHDAVNKLHKLLSAKQKRQALAVFGLMLLAAVFEFLSVTLLFPFVSILAQPNIVLSNRYLSALKSASGLTTVTEFTVLLGLITVLVIWTSMLVRACNVYFISRFGFSVMHALSLDMMRLNLARDYMFYLKQNTADLTRTILIDAEGVVRGILFPIMRVMLHAVISIFLMVLLVLINPLVAIVTSLALGTCIAGIYLVFRRGTLAAGRVRARADTARFRQAHEVFGGIKELRLLGRESSYSSRFAASSLEHANATARGETLALVPMFFVQGVAVSAGIAALLYLVWSYGELSAALPSIAAFAYGAYRLMPSLQSLMTEASVVRYTKPALDAFYWDHQAAVHARRVEIDATPQPITEVDTIDVKALDFQYEGQERPVLSGIDLRIARGERIGIVGSSGSGKSTLVDILVGLLRPTAGQILIDGAPLETIGPRRWQRSLGYVPQTIFLSDDTIRANIAFGVPEREIDQAAVEEAARAASLHRFVSRELGAGYDTVVGDRGIRLSGGQRQRIGIARALYRKPKILVFDEATSALDNETEAAVMAEIDALRERLTLITVAHRLSTVEPFDRIYVLDAGRVVGTGTYTFLSQHNGKFQDLLRPRAEANQVS